MIAGVSYGTKRLQYYLFPLKHSQVIAANAKKYNVDPYLIAAIIHEESRWRHQSRSSAGAVGLMQIMPDTALWISEKTGRPLEDGALLRPERNIAMGTWYFSWLSRRYGRDDLALAAYNSGDKTLDRWLKESGGKTPGSLVRTIPYKETREFVAKVKASRDRYRELYPVAF